MPSSFFMLLMNIRVSLLSTVLLLYAALAPAEVLRPSDEQAYVARYMSRFFPRQHLSQLKLDDMLSERIWNNFITSLDYERVFFLQADIDNFKVKINSLDDELKKGDLSFAFEIFDLYQKRLSNRCEYVEGLLKSEFDFSLDETYTWKRRDAAWVQDEKEWDDLWRKRIKNEMLRSKISEILKNEEPKTGQPDKSSSEEIPASTNSAAASTNSIPVIAPAEAVAKRYKQLLNIVKDYDADQVVQRYLTAFAAAYDPHSSYMSASSLEDFDIEMKLSLVGIGAILQAEDGAAKIVRLIPGGPASKDKREKRLQPGDKIIAVAQGETEAVDILHWPLNKIVQKIRGEKGTIVTLTVIPASDPSGATTKTVDLVRDEVKLEEQAVKWTAHEIHQGTNSVPLAVINVPAFYANLRVRETDSEYRSSADDVKKALKEIATNNVSGIILDLRNNGGGSLVDAIRMTGLFIKDGPVVQVVESSSAPKSLDDEDSSVEYDGPLVVLVNRLSASASEILAAALKDYGRAVIIGDSRTHGKGTVQTVVNIGSNPDFGALKITTAGFYRISGDSTQLRGVIPDIYIPSPLDYMELGEDSLQYPLEWTKIQPARYSKVSDLSETVETLRLKSDERIADSDEMKAYRQLIKQLKAVYETENVPLNLEARLAVSRAEKEISDIQARLSEGNAEDSADEPPVKDPVLMETLNILADLCTLSAVPATPEPQQVSPDQVSVINKFMDWIKDK